MGLIDEEKKHKIQLKHHFVSTTDQNNLYYFKKHNIYNKTSAVFQTSTATHCSALNPTCPLIQLYNDLVYWKWRVNLHVRISALNTRSHIVTDRVNTCWPGLPRYKWMHVPLRLKGTLRSLIHTAFVTKRGNHLYSYIHIFKVSGIFVKNKRKCLPKFTEETICEMLDFLIHIIFVKFGDRKLGQEAGTPLASTILPSLLPCFYMHMNRTFCFDWQNQNPRI